MTDEIRRALEQSHANDLFAIRQYVKWVRLRRAVHDMFYVQTHWVQPSQTRVHWIGR